MPARKNTPNASSGKGAYHHGNLRDALIDVAIELIASDGVHSFSLAEACRRLDVTVAAPYRHFTDREALFTAIAVRASDTMASMLDAASRQVVDPADKLVEMSRAWIDFAAVEPGLFETMYAKDVLPGNDELAEAVQQIVEAIVLPTLSLPGVTARQAGPLVVAIAASAQGYASFFRAGSFGRGPGSVESAGDMSALSTRAILAGRDVFTAVTEQPEVILAGRSLRNWMESYMEHDDCAVSQAVS